MRLRLLDLPLADDGETNRFALVADDVDLATLTDDERASLNAFGDAVGAAGVLISARRVEISSMTPLFQLRAEPGLLDRISAFRDALVRHLPPVAGKRLI